MAYVNSVRETYQKEIAGIKEAGLFKEERYIHSPQNADIEVEYPVGSSVKKVINLCANNYLGLSSHPDVVQAARDGLGTRGYGMSSVRFICGTQDIHRELEEQADRIPGHRRYVAVSLVHGRERGSVRSRPQRPGCDDFGSSRTRLHRGRHAPLQSHAGYVQAFGHGTPRREVAGASGQAAPADYHRRRVFDVLTRATKISSSRCQSGPKATCSRDTFAVSRNCANRLAWCSKR